jgi:hypothetical protein
MQHSVALNLIYTRKINYTRKFSKWELNLESYKCAMPFHDNNGPKTSETKKNPERIHISLPGAKTDSGAIIFVFVC